MRSDSTPYHRTPRVTNQLSPRRRTVLGVLTTPPCCRVIDGRLAHRARLYVFHYEVRVGLAATGIATGFRHGVKVKLSRVATAAVRLACRWPSAPRSR